MKVFSQLVSAQLENKASDYSAGTKGRIWHNTATGLTKWDDGSAVRTAVTTDNTQTLTNKTLTSPVVTGLTGTISTGTDIDLGTASNTSRITIAKDTLANITALTRKEGTVWYATDTDKLYKDDGTSLTEIGSGSGGSINYISNPDSESGTTGWATYADAAGTSPVDGTGGAPTTTLTRTTSTPLRGTGSFLITKDAANRQGEGVSYAFTCDTADKAKVLNVSFDYQIASGTFTSGDSSDLRVWIYDVTNAVLIPVSPYTIQGGGTVPTNPFKFTGTFQTASNSTSYRLIIHIATTNASAWTFKFDNVVVGPQIQLYGAPVGDWSSYTPTVTGCGTVSSSVVYYRRVGDSIEGQGYFVTGTTAASLASVTLPTGLSIDTAKIHANTSGNPGQKVGTWSQTATTGSGAIVTAVSTSATVIYFGNIEGNSAKLVAQNGNAAFASSQDVSFTFTVPIAGFSSTVLMSSDTDTRVVSARVSGDAASATVNNPIIFPTSNNDTHSAYSVSTGQYTVPVSGYYQVQGCLQSSTAGNRNVSIYLNNVAQNVVGFIPASSNGSFCGTIYATAGQTIHISTDGTIDVTANSNMSIFRLSGPSAIAASESVSALYESNTARSISNGSATTGQFLMEDLIFDTHGAYSTSTAIYTVPVSGKYRVSACAVSASSAGWTNTAVWSIRLYKNGSLNRHIATWQADSTATCLGYANGSTIVSCIAGDTLEPRIFQNSGSALNTDAVAAENWVSFERIGN